MSRISSSEVHNVFAMDADLLVKVPSRPRIIRELIAFPFDSESLLVSGTTSRKLLSGPFCKLLLQEIWPRLDGSSDVEELRSILDNYQNLDEILALLQRAGFLENGDMPSVEDFPDHVASFLGRHGPAAGHIDSRERAATLIKEAVVVVLASDTHASVVKERLLASGFTTVLDRHEAGRIKCNPTIYLVVGDKDGFGNLVDYIPKSSRAKTLLSLLSDDGVAIGPLYLPDLSPCIKCSMQAIESSFEGGDTPQPGFFRELIIQHLLGAVSNIEQRSLFSVSVTHAEVDGQWEQRKVSVSRSPGCAGCGLGEFSALDKKSDEGAAWRNFNSTMLPPWQVLSKRVHEGHYSPENIALVKQQDAPIDGKEMRLDLKAEDYVAKIIAGTDVPPLDQLQHAGLVLQLAYGFANTKVGESSYSKKISPTGGNLRSPEAYVYFQEVAGIDDGLYRYCAKTHALHLIDDQVDKLLLESSLGVRISGSCGIIIGVSCIKKLWSKYKVFSIRLAQLDAGVALSYVHDTSWALGVSTHECTDWRSELLLKQLQLPTCRRYYDIGSVVMLNFDEQQEKKRAKEVLDRDVVESLGRSLQSSLRYGLDPTPRWCLADRDSFVNFFGNAVRRTAARGFERQGIDLDKCQALAKTIHARANALMQCDALSSFYSLLIVNNIETPSFPAGMYISEASGELKLHNAINQSAEISECFNQRSLGSAPIIFIITTNMEKLLHTHGASGISIALMRASSLLMHCWLAARELGIEGCFSGGLIESEMRVRMNLDGYSRFPLFAFSAGQKATSAANALAE